MAAFERGGSVGGDLGCVWSGGGVWWRVSGEEIETSRAVIDTRQTAAGFPPVLARVILLTAPGIVHTATIVNEHVGIVWGSSPASSFRRPHARRMVEYH